MNSLYVIAQIIGLIAIVFALSIYQVRQRDDMLRLATVAAACFAVHFLFVGAYTGAAMNMLGAARNYLFLRIKNKRRMAWVMYVFIVLAVGLTVLTWQGWSSMFALAATCLSCVALWQTDPRVLRKIALMVTPLWFVYAAIHGSYPVMFVEVAILCSNLIGQYRFDHRHTIVTHRHAVRHA